MVVFQLGIFNIFAVGDVAYAYVDDEHVAVMSCQHAMEMGKFALLKELAAQMAPTLFNSVAGLQRLLFMDRSNVFQSTLRELNM